MVAGHSLGEFSALVANNTLSFEDALKLVYKIIGAKCPDGQTQSQLSHYLSFMGN